MTKFDLHRQVTEAHNQAIHLIQWATEMRAYLERIDYEPLCPKLHADVAFYVKHLKADTEAVISQGLRAVTYVDDSSAP